MGLKALIRRFRDNENGATTTDWVVLTAAMTVLAGTGYLATERGVTDAAETTQSNISSRPVR
ncbi:hypothetical protein [Roseovarius sp. SYSU LYC5161]|uniref:hypothetical protein n=1 Tax=Roseovarius halophilus (ex Wu et al. 2025) TaxID=3376060 RepID=UPI002870CB33|nr:hypothetical protein [Roseovarius sp.]